MFIIFFGLISASDKKYQWRIVVYDFEVEKTIDKKLGVLVADYFRTELSKFDKFYVLERKHFMRLLKERELSEKTSKLIKKRDIKEDGVLEANYMMTGEITRMGKEKRIYVRLVDLETGALVFPNTIEFKDRDNLKQIVKDFCQNMNRKIPTKQNSGKLLLEVEPKEVIVRLSTSDVTQYKDPFKRNLKSGRYNIYIEPLDKLRYKTYFKDFDIIPGKKNILKVSLEENIGDLYLDPILVKSKIYIDNKLIRYSIDQPIRIVGGKHQITVITPSGFIFNKSFIFDPETQEKLSIKYNFQNLLNYSEINLIKQSPLDLKIKSVKLFNDIILIVDEKGILSALNIFSLNKKWTFSKYKILDIMIIKKKLLSICNNLTDEKFFIVRLSPYTGDVLWKSRKYSSSKPISICDRKSGIIFYKNNKIIFIKEKDEKEINKKKLEITKKDSHNIDWSTSKLVDKCLFLINKQKNRIFKFKLPSGKLDWMQDFNFNIKKFVVIKKNLLILFRNNTIKLIDYRTGNTLWENPLRAKHVEFIKYNNGYIYFVNKNYVYWKVNQKNGNIEEHNILKPFNSSFEAPLSGFDINEFGQFILKIENHRIALYDNDIKSPIWIHKFHRKIKTFVKNKALLLVSSDDGETTIFGQKTNHNILGYIEHKDEINNTIIISTKMNSMKSNLKCVAINLKDFQQSIKNDLSEFQLLDLEILSKLGTRDLYIARINKNFSNINNGDLLFSPRILELNSISDGQFLFINGYFIGQNPKTVFGLSKDGNNIKIIQNKKNIWEKTIDFKRQLRLPCFSELKKEEVCSFFVTTNPSNTKFLVDSKKEYISPNPIPDLRIGQIVNIEIRKKGFRTIKERIKIKNIFDKRNYFLTLDTYPNKVQIKLGYPRKGRIIGWSEDNILNSKVVGEPLKHNFGFLTFVVNMEKQFMRKSSKRSLMKDFNIFGSFNIGLGLLNDYIGFSRYKHQNNPILLMLEGELGVQYFLRRFYKTRPLIFGLSILDNFISFSDKRVYLGSPRIYLGFHLKYYLKERLILKLFFRDLLYAKLYGRKKSWYYSEGCNDIVPCIEDSYSYSSRSGFCFGVKLSLFKQKVFKFNLSSSIEYSYYKSNFDIANEKGNSFWVSFVLH